MAIATNAQKIAGLYAAFFERAPDAEGLSYWETQFTGTATVNTIASLFAAHPVFETTYGAMTDVEFVNSIYLNVLGAAGDANGVDYWVGQLKNGGADARANFVAQFVNDALTVDLSTFTNLTAAELAVAQGRQDTLTNKANVGLYFSEKFGAASNITTTGDITTDPAYLAAQAAIKNVTADDSSVAAAQGRIDVAVGTSDPAGSLVGQNSELNAALVDLQAKTVAEEAALEAVALAANAASSTPITDEALLKAYVDSFVAAADTLSAVTDATDAIATAQAGVASATNALTTARATTSDATLKSAVVTEQAAVEADPAAKALLAASTSAKAALTATTDVAVLTSLQDALSVYVKAGGLTSEILGGVAAPTIGDLVNSVNTALNTKDDALTTGVDEAAVALKGFIDTLVSTGVSQYVVTPVAPATETTVAQKALQAAITKAEARDLAYEKSDAADGALAGNPKTAALVDAQDDVAARDVLIKATTDAAAVVTKEQADLVKVTAAFDAHTTAAENLVAAQEAITDLGYNNDGSVTAGNDLFVADATTVGATIIAAGFAAGDELFIGTQYVSGGVTTATTDLAALFAKGSASALEVYFEQNGANTVVHVETKAFANAATTPSDFAAITLTGVTASTLTFENGFVHVA